MNQDYPIEISCQEVHQLLSSDSDFLFIDCREASEHQTVHIPEAVLIPMSEFMNRTGELGSDQEKQVVIHCHHGGRSLRVANWLREQGFKNAQSMAGGIDAWAVEISPGMARY